MSHIRTDSSRCSGCTACSSICNLNAISIVEDDEGFSIPVLDEHICVDCGRCVKVCPVQKEYIEEENGKHPKAYAFRTKDSQARRESSSGGFAFSMAKFFIEQLHGTVCGCILDDDLVVRHVVTEDINVVKKMRDSKYVQSCMGNCFQQIRRYLEQGIHVLFTGTSCQVAGLQSYLAQTKIPTEKLLCVDMFCHGVPSPRIWKEYLCFLAEKSHCSITGFRFRSKHLGWGVASKGTGFLGIGYKDTAQGQIANLETHLWTELFFSNLCIRSYCHQCPYTKIEKPADITMADFWGIENVDPQFDDGIGTSLLLVQTEKGAQYLSYLYEEKKECNLDDAIRKQGNAFLPSQPNSQREQFWNDFGEHGLEYCLSKYLNYGMKRKIKDKIKRLMFRLHLRKRLY